MLLLALSLSLLVIVIVMIWRRRWIGRLSSLATLIAAAIAVIWMAQMGLLPGTTGPLENERAAVPGLDR
jgi:uncharacterized membrane protein YqjE